jgi:hypothetical protein
MMLQSPCKPPDVTAAMQRYMRAARSENTWRAYDAQWQRFQTWCRTRGVAPLPAAPVVVAQYVAENAQAGAARLMRWTAPAPGIDVPKGDRQRRIT